MCLNISLNSIKEDCDCECHYCKPITEQDRTIEHCVLKRVFKAVKRLINDEENVKKCY